MKQTAQQYIEKLEQQIEKMKCCENCNNYVIGSHGIKGKYFYRCLVDGCESGEKWRLKQND